MSLRATPAVHSGLTSLLVHPRRVAPPGDAHTYAVFSWSLAGGQPSSTKTERAKGSSPSYNHTAVLRQALALPASFSTQAGKGRGGEAEAEGGMGRWPFQRDGDTAGKERKRERERVRGWCKELERPTLRATWDGCGIRGARFVLHATIKWQEVCGNDCNRACD